MALRVSRRLLPFVVASVCLLLGCASPERFRTASQPGGKFLVHVVSTDGETLKQVSDWYSGNANGEKAISAANPGLDLSSLKVGDRILIPYSVVKRVEPLGPGLPRPERNEPAGSTDPLEEPAPAGAAFDEDFVDLPESGAAPTAATAPIDAAAPTDATALSAPAAPQAQQERPKEKETVKPSREAPPPTSAPRRVLDPLEELANSAEKAQRQLPPGVPVGPEQDQLGIDAFGSVQGQVPPSEPLQDAPAPPRSAPEPQGDPQVDQLRRELGLTQ